MTADKRAQGLVHLQGHRQRFLDSHVAVAISRQLRRRERAYRCQLDLAEQLLHGDIHQLDAQKPLHGMNVPTAGNEPVGRRAYNTQTHSCELSTRLLHLSQQADAVRNPGGTAMNDFTVTALLLQVRQYFHRRCQRIVLTRGQEVERRGGCLLQCRQ